MFLTPQTPDRNSDSCGFVALKRVGKDLKEGVCESRNFMIRVNGTKTPYLGPNSSYGKSNLRGVLSITYLIKIK